MCDVCWWGGGYYIWGNDDYNNNNCLCPQSAVDGIYGPRHIALQMGIPQAVPCLGLNRLCGTGFQAIVTAAQVFSCFLNS